MSRRLSRRAFLTAVLGLGAALAGCSARSEAEVDTDTPELILRYAENQPDDYPTTKAAHFFADLVNERTEGRLRVKVYSDGELGSELSVIEQMTFGGVDFTRVSLSQMAQYLSAFNVLQLPYLYTDSSQMWRVLDGDIGDEFRGKLDELSLVGLSWFDAGVRSFYTRTPISSFDELQGLTIRVQESDLMSRMALCLGAEPVQLVYSQVYAALHNGDIDGAENNWPSYEAVAHYEVAPYFLRDEHTRVPELQIASRAAIEKLAAIDESWPDLIEQCAYESSLEERRLWAEREAEAETALREWGVTVTELSDAEKKRFRDAVQPIYDDFSAEAELIARIRST